MTLTLPLFDFDAFAHGIRERLFTRPETAPAVQAVVIAKAETAKDVTGTEEPEFHGQWRVLKYL